MKISICIVEDNEHIRSALGQIIMLDNIFKLTGSFRNAEDAMEKIPLLKPNIVLMDINLGNGKSGIECVRFLKEKTPGTLFMMCTVYEEDEKIFEAIKAGANAYMLKKTAPHKMLEAIKELYDGGAPMSSQIARKIVHFVQTGQLQNPFETITPKKKLNRLSPRENEILELLASGLLYKEIAHNLSVSPETVRKHVYNIYEKLHVNNRVEAIKKFYNH